MLVWKDITDWEDYYEISDSGKVRNKITGHIIKEDRSNRSGYVRVTLYKKPRRKRYLLHRLVMMVFCGESKLEVNHKDSNKLNNSLDNLEYVTRSANELHCRKFGSKNNLYKPIIVTFNSGEIKKFETRTELANLLGVTRETIKFWLHGRNYGYTKYGISCIKYIEISKCQTTNCSAEANAVRL